MITFELHDEGFLDWIKGVEHSFISMAETMKQVAEMIRDETQLRTPVESGTLSKSYKWTVLADNSRMVVLQIRMSALNPRTGYDYAWIQHENTGYSHAPRELGFLNYRRDGDGYETVPSDASFWKRHIGEAKYLK